MCLGYFGVILTNIWVKRSDVGKPETSNEPSCRTSLNEIVVTYLFIHLFLFFYLFIYLFIYFFFLYEWFERLQCFQDSVNVYSCLLLLLLLLLFCVVFFRGGFVFKRYIKLDFFWKSYGGALNATFIVVRNGIGDPILNPWRGCLRFLSRF